MQYNTYPCLKVNEAARLCPGSCDMIHDIWDALLSLLFTAVLR